MMKLLTFLAGAFGGVALAWIAMFAFRPSTSIDTAWGVLEGAFVVGGAIGVLAGWRRSRSADPRR
jgi:uncharacterized YccA/Bax inhibitor family protein